MTAAAKPKSVPGRMLATIGKVTYVHPLTANDQDLLNHTALAKALGLRRLYLVIQGTSWRPRIERAGGIVAVYLPRARSRLLDYVVFVSTSTFAAFLLRARGVRYFQASEPTGGGIATAMVRLFTGGRLIVHLQGEVLTLPRDHHSVWERVLTRLLTKVVCRVSDTVRCVSRSVANDAVRAGVDPRKIEVMPMRYDSRSFQPDRHRVAGRELRAKLEVGKQQRVLLFVGNFNPHKGLMVLLDAISQAKRQHPEILLLLVGSGQLEGVLRQKVEELGIEAHVRFCGAVRHPEVPIYMSAADVFVLPSVDEGVPRVILEAMAMEVAVIATRVGGIPDLVNQAETGVLVDPGDSVKLAKAIKSVLDRPEETGQRSKAAAERVRKMFSIEAGASRYAEIVLSPRRQQTGASGRR